MERRPFLTGAPLTERFRLGPGETAIVRKPEQRDRLETLGANQLIFGNVAARLRAIIGICPRPFKEYPADASAYRGNS